MDDASKQTYRLSMIRASAIADRYLRTGASCFGLIRQYMGKVNGMGEQGRPTAYKPEYVGWAYKFALLGATDVQIGEALGVCEKTINNWKIEHPEFFTALKEGKLFADANMTASLYKRGLGYRYTEVTKELNEKGEMIVTKEVEKEMPPDTGANAFWHKNRQPAAWRDKQEVQVDAHNVNENITSLADLLNDPVKDREIPGDD